MGKARSLADQLGTRAEAVLLGSGTAPASLSLLSAGAHRVYVCDDPAFAVYDPECLVATLVGLAKAHAPEILLLGSTAMGREVAPLVAACLQTGLTAHCIDLSLNDQNILEQKIPAYGGLLSIICPERRPQMATVAKGVFAAPDLAPSPSGEIIAVPVSQDVSGRVKTLEVVRAEPDTVPLDTAATIVAGGAGAGDAGGWRQIAALAKALNAALGCTRPAVDEGWAPLDTMIGQSGCMVSPALYIGVGVSGEQQHMVGITQAKVMVAINNDKHSPVFNQVDFGIVEDCRQFLPVLIEKIKNRQATRMTCG